MTPSTLALPPPAETLWQAVSETVREELRSMGDRQTQYAIGGGSILAARWKHRDSYDIDLVVQPDTPLAAGAGRLRYHQGERERAEGP